MGSSFVFSLSIAGSTAAGSVFLFMLTVFMVAVFWMRVKRDSVDGNVSPASEHEEPHPPHLGERADEVPAVFLSHSGKQKPFVENLYTALQNANRTAFFDQHSLPKGSRFPPHIKRAACSCKLGVIVLSDDFLTSKWPMLELQILVLQRGPNASVLPLFYKLLPEDLKSAKNLCKWRRTWKQNAAHDADKWERAVRALGAFNGEIFTPRTSEAAYLKQVVRHICNRVPSHTSYDLSPIQGHRRLSQEVARQFEHIVEAEKVRMVGLHGVGGLGKTTVCHIMVNFYDSEYPGRSHLLEFPTDGDHKKIVQECKKALKKLTNLSNEHLLNEMDSFDQVVQLMRENLRRYDVFLAIDNVWESSLEAAERILGVNFSANSKILLMSRSEQVLKNLLRSHNNSSVGALPAPEHEEAFQIFQETFKLGDLDSLVNRNQLDSVLRRCMFSGNYHPLALKALGQHVQRVFELEGSKKMEHHLSLILKENRDLQNLEGVIGLNYENLPEHKKHMFLDIAVLLIKTVFTSGLTYAKAHQWLCFLYKGFSKSKITGLIYELALDGLIQLEMDECGEKMIRVHELYSDLAQREAASSSRFCTDKSPRLTEEIEWESLERVILKPGHNPHFVEKLQEQECRKLQVLYAVGIDFLNGIRVDLMPSLCVLMLDGGTLGSIQNWSAATNLAIVQFTFLRCVPPLQPIPSLPCLEEFTIKDCGTVEGPPNLDGCHHLKKLVLAEASLFKETEYLKASYFNSLENLEMMLYIGGYLNRSRVPNLNPLVQLKHLEVVSCTFDEGIGGLDALENLQRFYVRDCPCLRNLDGLNGLLQLQVVHVQECAGLRKLPDLRALTCLVSLDLDENESMEEVGGLSATLKDVSVTYCGGLKRMPDLSGLTGLDTLVLEENESMEEVGGEYLSSTLEHLSIYRCRQLRSFSSLKNCLHLQTLTASAHHINGSLEKLANLRELRLIYGKWTTRSCFFPDLQWKCLTLLQDLSIEECESINDVGCLGPLTNLKRLTLSDCNSLQGISELGCVAMSLQRLEVRHCEAVEEIGDLSVLQSLVELDLFDCPSLKKVSGFMSILTQLQSLSLWECGSLEENTIPDVSFLSSVKNVGIWRCGKLKDFSRGLPSLWPW